VSIAACRAGGQYPSVCRIIKVDPGDAGHLSRQSRSPWRAEWEAANSIKCRTIVDNPVLLKESTRA
jgi:hypothetical protein